MTRTGAIARLKDTVGPNGWTDDPHDIAPHLSEGRGLFHGDTALLLRPNSTGQVADIVAVCAKAQIGIVPQGGNTGLCGGAVPRAGQGEIVLSLARMNRIRAIDAANFTLVAEAGCILADLQAAAENADRLFPLSLGAEGSCMIGGNLSTDAGGVGVLRYGTARELVLGLEVVLPDGRVWDGLRALRKDATGYDLKHLFIGAEGTLGVITAAVLKLFPRPRQQETALIGLASVEAAVALLALARTYSGDAVSAFELLPRIGLEFARRHFTDVPNPLANKHAWYVLVELTSSRTGQDLRPLLEGLLAQALDCGLIEDATLAANTTQTRALWRLREVMPEAQRFEGASIKHDISVPVSAIPAFIANAGAALAKAVPGSRLVAFGHIGDGNVHFNLSQPEGANPEAFLARWDEITRKVHDIAVAMGGSISAEHGIGQLKIAELERLRAPLELELMRRIKETLDPTGIMNPGKLLRQV